MIGFIDHFSTRNVTIGNCSATANLHNLQFTAANTSVLSLLQSPLSASWQRILTQKPQHSHWVTHSYRGTIAHVKSSLYSQTFNSTEMHSIIPIPQFLSSTPLLPSSYPGKTASRNSTDLNDLLCPFYYPSSWTTQKTQLLSFWGMFPRHCIAMVAVQTT
jgi:hypothetical protein